MDKKLRNYFMMSDVPRLIGIGMMAAGAILLLLAWFVPIGLFFWILMCLCLAGGPVLFWVAGSMRASESDIDEHLKRSTSDMGLSPSDESKYRKRLLSSMPPQTVSAYVYREGLMLARSKDGTVRSEEYAKAMIYVLTDGIVIISRTVSLISDEKQNQTIEIPCASLEKAELVSEKKQLSFRKKSFEIKESFLQIVHDGITLQIPTQLDFKLEQFVEKLNEMAAAQN